MIFHQLSIQRPTAQNSSVNLWMQRLNTTVHDLWKPCVLSYVRYRNAHGLNRLIGTPSRQNIHPALMELVHQNFDVAFVRDAYERASNGQFCHVVESVLIVVCTIMRLYPELDLVRLESVAVTLGCRDG